MRLIPKPLTAYLIIFLKEIFGQTYNELSLKQTLYIRVTVVST